MTDDCALTLKKHALKTQQDHAYSVSYMYMCADVKLQQTCIRVCMSLLVRVAMSCAYSVTHRVSLVRWHDIAAAAHLCLSLSAGMILMSSQITLACFLLDSFCHGIAILVKFLGRWSLVRIFTCRLTVIMSFPNCLSHSNYLFNYFANYFIIEAQHTYLPMGASDYLKPNAILCIHTNKDLCFMYHETLYENKFTVP